MQQVYRRIAVALALGLVLGAPAIGRADFGDSWAAPAAKADADYAAAVKAIDAKDWNQAIALLNKALARNDKNADIHNLLGYSERKRGNLEVAFKHYERALTLDPKHLGANEYLGEAYLQAGNVAKAEAQLAKLDKLCTFGCSEYKTLKQRVAEYKQKK
jgi:Flp pilus assembly protein TadD